MLLLLSLIALGFPFGSAKVPTDIEVADVSLWEGSSFPYPEPIVRDTVLSVMTGTGGVVVDTDFRLYASTITYLPPGQTMPVIVRLDQKAEDTTSLLVGVVGSVESMPIQDRLINAVRDRFSMLP
ncbi:hypothetical protein PB2503_10264 [Parvularcula bermudensis HTCC2503]|uniref:Uncharacterized protein n=1 Tax=Parvularcula bermudensis (strain ATCC BAA-594 / HTCC2503 / KCTC 12087) TaxID=314260 RepID=E0TFY5_PARBH|nr:hypothetical protein [Parvularcula bermudensis]ADM10104.1 hypothetical protein PB2503_10264 [Parvularcula bermudensis HTCC2503]